VGTVDEVHTWKGHYDELEVNHAYIQWLFPNCFASQFNSESQALTMDEARSFQNDLGIARNYIKSYKLFLDFLGLELVDEKSGAISRAPGGEKRLFAALVQNPHNQLRLRRLLASLAVTGFKRYMRPLVEHLTWEVSGKQRSGGAAPALKALQKGPGMITETWAQYIDNNPENFHRNTKATLAECADSVFFTGGKAMSRLENDGVMFRAPRSFRML
jgi:hypothetical protein